MIFYVNMILNSSYLFCQTPPYPLEASIIIVLADFLGSLVRPKVVRSVHYCPATQKSIERRYQDLTSYDAFPSSAIYPTKVGTYSPVSSKLVNHDWLTRGWGGLLLSKTF